MQQALPYRTYLPATSSRPSPAGRDDVNKLIIGGGGGVKSSVIKSIVSENAVVVFGRRGCCMSHVVKRLLEGHGVNSAVFEVDEGEEEDRLVEELSKKMINNDDDDDKGSQQQQLPAVFVGGKLFGGLDRLMATHITGELVPILKDAGALWL